MRGALHRVLSRLEAVSSVRVEGRRPRLSTVLKIESLLSFDGTDSADRVAALDALDFDDEEDREAAIEAVYYQMALGMIYGSMGPGTPFTSQTMLDIHSMLRFGRLASESGTKVRTREYRPRTHDDGTPLHVPPTPAEAPALLDELCAFVGSDLYSPIGQAAVAHFQLEEIKPFKTGLDRTGRLLSHAIIYRRGLSRGLVAPIGLAPAIDTDRHARSLLPYRFEDTQGRVDVEEAVGRWARLPGGRRVLGGNPFPARRLARAVRQAKQGLGRGRLAGPHAWSTRTHGAPGGAASRTQHLIHQRGTPAPGRRGHRRLRGRLRSQQNLPRPRSRGSARKSGEQAHPQPPRCPRLFRRVRLADGCSRAPGAPVRPAFPRLCPAPRTRVLTIE